MIRVAARPLIWLAPLLAACLLWQLGGRLTLAIADPHGRDLLRGFYPFERGALGTFRWSAAEATLLLPARPLPGVLELRGAVAPDGTRVTLDLGGHATVELPATPGALVPRTYRLLWPGTGDSAGIALVGLRAMLPGETAEVRPLGLALSTATLRSLGGPRLPPAVLTLVLLLAPPLLAVCLRAAGFAVLPATAIALAAGLLAGGLAWALPLAAQPLLLDAQAVLALPVLRWWLAVQLVALAGTPLAAYLFRSLPLRGLLFAKPLGMLLVGWGCLALGALGLRLSVATILAAALAATLAGLWALRAEGRRATLALIRSRWRTLVAGECFFAAALMFGLWLRWNGAIGPSIAATEKLLNLALLQSVLAAPAFPPPDLWLSGYTVNYYYAGYIPVAALALLAGTSPGQAFNLGVATTFALTALGVAALVATLTALDRRTANEAGRTINEPTVESHEFHKLAQIPQTRANSWNSWLSPQAGIVAAALLGVALVLLAGNQFGALQLILGGSQPRVLDGRQLAEALVQRLGGAAEIRLSRPTPPTADYGALTGWTPAREAEFDWWAPSRVVHDDLSTAEGVERRHAITEFPFFTFFLGDLHPHLLALPYGVLALALALSTLARPAPPVFLLSWRGRLELLLTGVVLGWIYAVNPWDAPGYALLYVGALALLYARLWAGERTWHMEWLQGSLLVGLAALLVAMPFLRAYQAPFGGTGANLLASVPLLARIGAVLGPAPAHTGLHTFVAIFGLFLLPLLALAGGAVQKAEGRRQRARRAAAGAWLLVLGTLLAGLAIGFPLLALLPLALLFTWQASRARDRPALALALWGAAVASLAVLAADLVYVRDHLEGQMSRYNTVFKTYYQAWVIWGTLAAYAIWALTFTTKARRHAGTKFSRLFVPSRLRAFVFASLFLPLLAGALVYPVETIRRGERWEPLERELDGLTLLARTRPDDAAALAWLTRNARPGEVLLAAFCTCASDEIGRAAAWTGLPTVLGRSEGQQRLWRAGIPADLAEIARRERDVPQIYQTTDPDEARTLLARYGVAFVVVGTTERELYEAAGLAKFDALLTPAFAQGQVRIYRVTPP
jgi:YYY domain-containing protein